MCSFLGYFFLLGLLVFLFVCLFAFVFVWLAFYTLCFSLVVLLFCFVGGVFVLGLVCIGVLFSFYDGVLSTCPVGVLLRGMMSPCGG